jgi:hypothetical protein
MAGQPPKLDRLLEEEDALRDLSPMEGALGLNSSDYRRMYDLFLRLVQDAQSLRADPHAFLTPEGRYNDKIINAYAKLMGLAMKGMESLNRMRNNDKMVSTMLDSNARELSQLACVDLGVEIKSIIDMIDGGASSEDTVMSLRRLLYRRVPEIFLRGATSSLKSTKEEFGLLH